MELRRLSNEELREIYNGASREAEHASPNVEEFWSDLGYDIYRILVDRLGLDQALDYLEAPEN